MFTHYRTQGIVLKKENRGESNQSITFYTKDFGRLEISARAIRKISSKLRAGTEIFYLSEIEFIQGKRQKTLTDAIPKEKFPNLRRDLLKTKTAHKIVEAFDALVIHTEKDKNLWHLLLSTMEDVNYSEFKITGLRMLYYYFIWNLLSHLGYLPELYHCVLCRKKLVPEKNFFSPEKGGVVCGSCHMRTGEEKEISANAIKILRTLTEKKISPGRLKISGNNLKELRDITDYFLEKLILPITNRQ